MITVKEIMSSELVTIEEGDTLESAAELFNNHKFHHLPVVNKFGEFVGLLSSSDFDRSMHGDFLFKSEDKEAYNKLILKTNPVLRSMQRELVTIDEDADIVDAYKLLKNSTFRCLPVTRDAKLCGIVTNQDFVDYLMDYLLIHKRVL